MSNIVLARLGENIKASTAGQVAASSGSTTAPQLVDNTFSFKNKIINGNFDMWQRNTSFNAVAINAYTADRWAISYNNGGTRNVTRQSFSSGQTDVPNNPFYFLRVQQTVAGTGGAFNAINQKIESSRTLSGKRAVLTFWAKGSTSFSVSTALQQWFGTGGSPDPQVIIDGGAVAITTSWQKYTVNFQLPSVAGKILGTDSLTDFLQLTFFFPINSTFTFDLAQVQLEEGSYATSFEQRPIGTELALCQRYYQFYGGALSLAGGTSTGSNLVITTLLPVVMRIPAVINWLSFTSSQAQGVSLLTGGVSDRYFIQGRTTISNTTPYGSMGVFSLAYNDVSFDAEF